MPQGVETIWHHSMWFLIMHTVSKFQFFIHIFTVVKPKNKNQNFKNGEKGACFKRLFQSNISSLIN